MYDRELLTLIQTTAALFKRKGMVRDLLHLCIAEVIEQKLLTVEDSFLFAVRIQSPALIQIYLNKGISVDNNDGGAMRWACRYDLVDLAKFLIRKGAKRDKVEYFRIMETQGSFQMLNYMPPPADYSPQYSHCRNLIINNISPPITGDLNYLFNLSIEYHDKVVFNFLSKELDKDVTKAQERVVIAAGSMYATDAEILEKLLANCPEYENWSLLLRNSIQVLNLVIFRHLLGKVASPAIIKECYVVACRCKCREIAAVLLPMLTDLSSADINDIISHVIINYDPMILEEFLAHYKINIGYAGALCLGRSSNWKLITRLLPLVCPDYFYLVIYSAFRQRKKQIPKLLWDYAQVNCRDFKLKTCITFAFSQGDSWVVVEMADYLSLDDFLYFLFLIKGMIYRYAVLGVLGELLNVLPKDKMEIFRTYVIKEDWLADFCLEKLNYTTPQHLIVACKNDNLEMVEKILAIGVDIHAENDRALRTAAYEGHLRIVKYLILNGADPRANNNEAYKWAYHAKNLDVANYLTKFL